MRPEKSCSALLEDRKTSLQTVESTVTSTSEDYLCTNCQCSPLRNKGLLHAHIACILNHPYHTSFLNSRVQYLLIFATPVLELYHFPYNMLVFTHTLSEYQTLIHIVQINFLQ
jgi:hypothetical protein